VLSNKEYVNKPVPRQVYTLLMLYTDNRSPIIGKLRLEKLIFLLDQTIRRKRLHIADKLYDFRPYQYGPFSEEVYDDIELLKDLGLVYVEERQGDQVFEITHKGTALVERMLKEKVIPLSLFNEVEYIKRKWNRADLRSLLEYIYKNFKEYTQKSLIRGMFG